MLLVIDIQQNLVTFGWLSLGILIILIAYRLLVKRMKHGQIEKELYLILHPIEKDPAIGTVPIFFEMHSPMNVEISIFSTNKGLNRVIENKTFKKGGNIIQLDTREFENGFYFYQAKTENQKTRKLIEIRN
ncbi:MAG TPA: T9SS type A sorting domain-containing protein [Brumimicrobium sp.]|nr:T9SS type A sorting domain-containing protein [Brumimicrobium sp.]